MPADGLEGGATRLNWGCGPCARDGWLNADLQIIRYGSSRTPFTFDFARELLLRAGFRAVARCRFGETATAHAAIVDLDNRERESFFVEATK